jgi:hypothetical protein
VLALLNGEYLHVLLNGVDVTDRCCYADDRRGYVVTFVPRTVGRGVLLDPRTQRPVRVFTWGQVEIIRRVVDPRELDGVTVPNRACIDKQKATMRGSHGID